MKSKTDQTRHPVRIFLVEDVDHEALAFTRTLDKSDLQFDITHVGNGEDALKQLMAQPQSFDIAVIDHRLSAMTGFDLCKELLASEIQLPLVLLTGFGDEALAVEALKEGVDDYLVKDSHQGYLKLLHVVLPEIIKRHTEKIEHKRVEEERKKLVVELQDALSKIKTLQGIIPICSYCKKIRDDKGNWDQLESYISHHSDAKFSHGACPECYQKEMAKIQPEDSKNP